MDRCFIEAIYYGFYLELLFISFVTRFSRSNIRVRFKRLAHLYARHTRCFILYVNSSDRKSLGRPCFTRLHESATENCSECSEGSGSGIGNALLSIEERCRGPNGIRVKVSRDRAVAGMLLSRKHCHVSPTRILSSAEKGELGDL